MLQSLCNIITEVIFGKKQITDLVHTKGEGITQEHKYPERASLVDQQ